MNWPMLSLENRIRLDALKARGELRVPGNISYQAADDLVATGLVKRKVTK